MITDTTHSPTLNPLDSNFINPIINDELTATFTEASQQLHSIRDFIRFCVTQLRQYDVVVAQGTTDEFAEAAALVLHCLALDWSADEQILDCRLLNSEKQQILTLLQQRITARKPLSYLLNLSYFCDMPFYVDERVLIPRSPIAELIKQQFHPYFTTNPLAKQLQLTGFFAHGLPANNYAQPKRILDLCTGSGCIAIALASYFADSMVDASDIDKDALEVAAVNIEHHGLTHQVNLLESDLFSKIPPQHQYELIVTNPPYVDAEQMAELPPEFLHEPQHALAAGQDGLDLVHHILAQAANYLTSNGLLVCEVGDSAWALNQAYPQVEFNWLNFTNANTGEHGIFAITAHELKHHQYLFAAMLAQ